MRISLDCGREGLIHLSNQLPRAQPGHEKELSAELWDLLYQRLKAIAHGQLRQESKPDLLQPTALVNEAWLRMTDLQLQFNDQEHFLAMAAKVMRRVLVDQARANRAAKRDAGLRVTLSSALSEPPLSVDMLDVDQAMDQLASHDQRKADIVEQSYFGGMTYQQIGKRLTISEATVKRELRTARAWLISVIGEVP